MRGITKLIDAALTNNEDCSKFAQAVFDQLSKGKGGNLMDAFNAFLDQKKPHDLFTRVKPKVVLMSDC